jgi:hypothetical protein
MDITHHHPIIIYYNVVNVVKLSIEPLLVLLQASTGGIYDHVATIPTTTTTSTSIYQHPIFSAIQSYVCVALKYNRYLICILHSYLHYTHTQERVQS